MNRTITWQTKTLGEVCEIINGGTPKTTIPKYWNGKHLWITPAEMGKRYNPFVSETERKLTDLGLKDSSAQLLPPYSVILSSRAPIGHLVINTAPMATNQGCKGLVPQNGLDSKYLYYYLGSVVGLLNDLGTGATFKEISGGKLREVTIPTPPVVVQKQIVKILDEIFEKIAKAKENAEKNLQNARELFESYLQSIFANSGDGWEEKKLEEIAEVKDGTHDSPKYVKVGIPFVTQKNIKEDGFSLDDTKFITREDHEKFYKRSNVAFGDILISMIGANRGMTCIVDNKITFSIKNVGLVKRNNIINQYYLLYYFKSSFAADYVKYSSRGGAQEFVGLTALRNFPIVLAPKNEQQNIVAKLDALSAETKKLEVIYQQKLDDLEELKKSILQKAFNGELAGARS